MKWAFHRPDKARLVLDLETFSEVNLKATGPYPYAEHPSTGVHCVGWEIRGGHHPGKGLWLPGQPVPEPIRLHLDQHAGPVIAHNWLFEYCIWALVLRPRYGWPRAPEPRMWSCTMARALYHGLPAGLDLLSVALDLDHKKDPTARGNMLRLARPRAKAPDGKALTWWHEDKVRGPEMLRDLYAYCVQDVAAESEADDKLPELPPDERCVFLLDAEINLRGVKLDLDLVDALDLLAQDELHRLDQCMNVGTSGAVRSVNQVGALTAWANAQGVPVPSLDKQNLPAAIDAARGTAVEFPLRVRQEAAKSSTAKLTAMRRAVSHDGRARLLFQYYGAGRTGRWAGRRVQPQNMPRPLLKGGEVDAAIAWVLRGHSAQDTATFFAPTVLETVSSCLRGCLVPAPGHLLVSVDLAQIEARMIAWLAGQQDILAVFARGEDVYTYTARKIGSNDRQLGKVLVLACGFGMGGPKFAHTAGVYGITLDETAATQLVWDWREANSAITLFWAELGRVFARVAQSAPGHWERLGQLTLGRTGKAVRIRLPSGRELVYQAAEVTQDAKGRDEISYMGVHQLTNKWTRLRTYGGKLAENVTQAAARDVLTRGALALQAAGKLLIGTVHDEAVFETPADRADADLAGALSIFRQTPVWAPGLPVGAEGWIGPRYRKG